MNILKFRVFLKNFLQFQEEMASSTASELSSNLAHLTVEQKKQASDQQWKKIKLCLYWWVFLYKKCNK